MAEGKVGAAFAGLVLGPDEGGVEDVPAEFAEDGQDDALGDGLLVLEPALAEAGDDVGE